jgi:hypothetical protein
MLPARMVLITAWLLAVAAVGLSDWAWSSWLRQLFVVLPIAVALGLGLWRFDHWVVSARDEHTRQDEARTIESFKKQLPDPRLVTLRIQAFALAGELNQYADDAERRIAGKYERRYVGKSHKEIQLIDGMTDAQVERALKDWIAAAAEYHARYDNRVTDLLGQIAVATGKDISITMSTSKAVRDTLTFKVKDVANGITNLAGTLP